MESDPNLLKNTYTLRDFRGYSSNSCDNIWQMVLLCYQAPLMHKLLFLAKRSCAVVIKNCTGIKNECICFVSLQAVGTKGL